MIQIIPRDVNIIKIKANFLKSVKIKISEFNDDVIIPGSFIPKISREDIEVYKLLYHPRGSNIFYSLSRRYIYHQKQKTYLNDKLLFTSFRSIEEAFRFVDIFGSKLYSSTKDYEDVLLVNCIIPSNSLYFEYTFNRIEVDGIDMERFTYYYSDNIILRETDIDIIEKYYYE